MGVVLWVPDTIEEVIQIAAEQLSFHSGSSVLLEDGCKILDPSMIMDGQKLFLASDEQLKRKEYWH